MNPALPSARRPTWRCFSSVALIAVAVTGCVATPTPTPDFDREVARVAGTTEAIRFDTHGGPTDVAEPPGATLTLPDAVSLTLAHDAQLQAAIARVHAALADCRQARLLPNPVLSIAFRFPEGGGKPIIDAGLAADLTSLLQRPRRLSAADARLRAAGGEVLTVALDVVAAVQQHYAAIQALDAELAVLEERGKLIARLLDLAQARLNQGEGTRLDVTTLQTQRVELEADVAERELERRVERLALTRLIGSPSDAAVWRVSKWEALPTIAGTEGDWIAAAAANRPEIQVQRWELAALGDELANAKAFPFDGAEIGVDSERDENWSVGPAISIPLPFLDWGQARRDRAKAQVVEARHKLTQAGRVVVEEVRQAYVTYVSTDATLAKVRTQLVPLQEQRRQQAEAAYLAGQTDITALLLAEQDLQASRTKLVALQRKTAEAFTRLQRAAGGPGAAPATSAASQLSTRPVATTQSAR